MSCTTACLLLILSLFRGIINLGFPYSPAVVGTAHDLGPQVLPVEMMGWKPPAPSHRKPKLEPRTKLPVSVTPTNGCGEAARRKPAKSAPTIRLFAIITPSMG